MSDKKKRPAAVKTAAGKTNSKQNTKKSKADAERYAKKLIENKQKEQLLRQKKSEEIKKKRAQQSEQQKKAELKEQKKTQKKNELIEWRERSAVRLKRFRKKFKYYTSKKFLGSFNYGRIFLFIVVPLVLIILGFVNLFKTVPFNVPSEIRSYEYKGRLEDETALCENVFKAQQEDYLNELEIRGSRKFDFYINPVIKVEDDGYTHNLCFGNPEENDCVLIATIFDSDEEVIYRSLGLVDGTEINDAKMFESLKYGIHNVKVAVNAYDKKTNEKIGTKYAEIKLAVGVDGDEK